MEHTAQQTPKVIPLSQLRSFGLLMGGVFLLVALWPFLLGGEVIRLWAAIVASCFGLVGLVYPLALGPVFRVWMKIGERLGWINSRIILSLLFFVIFTPMRVILSLLGKKPLSLSYDPEAGTYRVPKKARDTKHLLKTF